MSRGSDGSQKKRLVAAICVVAIFLGFLYVYGGSIFGSQNSGSSALEYGRSLKRKFQHWWKSTFNIGGKPMLNRMLLKVKSFNIGPPTTVVERQPFSTSVLT